MSSWYPLPQLTGASILGSALLVRVAPDYVLSHSYVWTAVQLFALLFSIWATWIVVFYPKLFSPLRDLPQPAGGSFLMGHFSRIMKEPSGAPAVEWLNDIPNEGVIRYLNHFNNDRVMPTSAKALSEVLTLRSYDFIKPHFMRAGIGRLLGIGVLLAEGDEHKVQRKNLMPAFAFRHVKDLYQVFWDKSVELSNAMSSEIVGDSSASEKQGGASSTVEVAGWASRATLDIIGLAGMGQDFGSLKDPENELYRVYRLVFEPTKQARMLGLLSLFLPAWILRNVPIQRNHDVEAAITVIKDTALRLIRQKKAKMEKNDAAGIDILSVALKSGGFTESNLVDQMMTFLAAGHETTATALTWAVYYLCKHPEIQARLREQIRSQLPSLSSTTPISSTDFDKVPYLHAVCNEVLRIQPPVPMTIRETDNNTGIIGYPVPDGTRVIIAIWAVNKSRELWGPTAGDFIPERWLDESGKANNTGGATSNYAYMTFLHGPRSCIGQAFAKAEFACLVASLVGRFEMELPDPSYVPEIRGGITSKPENGLQVKMKIVEGW
ncbi:MAG: hypothetical protein M1837_005093 [Sclerophora amabilis]|nr:MAG: hypothetical protein M1837_005093 [Sclerophora amabilis]